MAPKLFRSSTIQGFVELFRLLNSGAPQAPIASRDPNKMIASILERPSRDQ
jgi:hypothetical protein